MRTSAKLAVFASIVAISGLAFSQSTPKQQPAPKATVAQAGTPGSAAAGQTVAPAAPAAGGASLGVAAAATAAVVAAGAAASNSSSTTSHFNP